MTTLLKESFVFVADKLEVYQHPCARLLDIGCGDGSFLGYLAGRFPFVSLSGVDISSESVREARKTKASVFYQDFRKAKIGKFDIVTMIGVHSEFSYVKEWLPHLLNKGKNKATYFVMGYFNPYPIDVWTIWTYKETTNPKGFNIISQKTVLEELKKRGYVGLFEEFKIETAIPKGPDPTKAWTFKDENGDNVQTNGACQILPFSLLTIVRKSNEKAIPRQR